MHSPVDVTVAGDTAELSAFGDEMVARGVFFRELNLDYAFHTRSMDPIRDKLLEALEGLAPQGATIAFVSTVTGESLRGQDLDAEYWWRNVRAPVLFGPAVATLLDRRGCGAVVEVGPQPVLTGSLRRQCAVADRPVAVIPTLSREAAGADAMRVACAAVLAAGADVEWETWFPDGGRVVSLPPYPWQRERHFNGSPDWWLARSGQLGVGTGHPLLGDRLPCVEPTWQVSVEPARLGWIGDHVVSSAVVMPGAAYLEMALAAGQAAGSVPLEVTDLDIARALALPWDDPQSDVTLQTCLSGEVVRAQAHRRPVRSRHHVHRRRPGHRRDLRARLICPASRIALHISSNRLTSQSSA